MVHYYYRALEKVTAGILAMMNDVYISQYTYNKASDSWSRGYYRVPIEIGTKDKIFREYEQSLASSTKRYFNVPRMALMLNNISRFSEKQTNQLNVIKKQTLEQSSDGRKLLSYLRNPAWWKANYTLSIITKHMDDMAQILEQICPVFQPQRSLTIKLIPEVDVSLALETTISDDISFEVEDQLDPQSVRFINCSFSITAPVPMFPPISDSAIISKIITRFAAVSDFDIRDIADVKDLEEFKIYGDRGPGTSLRLTATVTGVES